MSVPLVCSACAVDLSDGTDAGIVGPVSSGRAVLFGEALDGAPAGIMPRLFCSREHLLSFLAHPAARAPRPVAPDVWPVVPPPGGVPGLRLIRGGRA